MSTPPSDPIGAAIHAQAEAMALVLSHESTIERLRAENADLKASLAAMAGLTGEQTEQLRAENASLKREIESVRDGNERHLQMIKILRGENVRLGEALERAGWECSALLSHLEQDAENFVSRGELITRLRMWLKWLAPREGG